MGITLCYTNNRKLDNNRKYAYINGTIPRVKKIRNA